MLGNQAGADPYRDGPEAADADAEEGTGAQHGGVVGRQRLLGVFDGQGQLFTEPGFNGCAHMTASAEVRPGSPVEGAADRYRLWVRTMFTDLAREAGVADAEGLARQLHLLYDGAGISARMDRDPSAATTARAAAAALFDAAVKDKELVDAGQ
nr:hypothetical protein [Streptomyces sp. SID5469]